MASFVTTLAPTPFGFFDSDSEFQTEADSIVTFVKRRLGDDVLSVELTSKQVWACFEEAFCEYGAIVNQIQAKSQLSNLMGTSTGSLTGGENRFPTQTLEFALRMASPYITHAGLGGSYNTVSGSIKLELGKQDYDLYTDLVDGNNVPIVSSSLNPSRGKMRIFEVMHFSPQAAYRFFDTTSAINYLNNEFSFESFTPETVFYVLPVFEDVLRGGQMKISNQVRRSNYSYQVIGRNLRLFPKPVTVDSINPRVWVRVGFENDPYFPAFNDPTSYGVNGIQNLPFGNLTYSKINSIGRQWTRQYTLALCKEVLGLVRSKFGSVPIPGGEVQLNGSDLVSQGREEKDKLRTELRELLDTLTYDKLVESQATQVDNLQKTLRAIPIPIGKAITVG
jgi:hypothetical protein